MLLSNYPVVRLGLADAAALGPVVLLAVGGGRQFLQLCGPEPAVYFVGEQIGAVAALEITEPARCPDVFHLKEKKNLNNLKTI